MKKSKVKKVVQFVPVQVEGGNLRIVTFEVCEVEVIGKGLLLPGEPATYSRKNIYMYSIERVTYKRCAPSPAMYTHTYT